jgi:hypothetical protein
MSAFKLASDLSKLSSEELMAKLVVRTGMTAREWSDHFACTLEQQRIIAKGYLDAHWVKEASVYQEVLSILLALATIAGAVSGIATAGTAVAELKAAL